MKEILMLAVALMGFGSGEVEAQQDFDELVRQGDTYMKRGLIRRSRLTAYSGEVIWYYDETKTAVYASGRMADGVWSCTHFTDHMSALNKFMEDLNPNFTQAQGEAWMARLTEVNDRNDQLITSLGTSPSQCR